MSNEIKNGQNSLMEKIDDKISNEESNNNYNDINYWKIENTLSNEVKENVESRKNIKPDDNDDEDELLNIAIKLEKQEKDKIVNNKFIIDSKSNTHIIIKTDLNISSSSNIDNNNNQRKNGNKIQPA